GDGGTGDGGTDGGTGDGGTGDGGTGDGGTGDGGTTGDGGGGDGGSDVAPGDLFINELMASNATTIADEGGAFPDWVELYNPTGADISLAGFTITDDLLEPDKHALDGSLVVPAGGFLLLWADDDVADGPQHLGFKLSAKGESLALYAPDGTEIDGVSFGPQSTDVSAARMPDGGAGWTLADPATPGASNEGGR
ncbi:lamin tail domain-containing protein, partial [Myxococcota bacterium]|nr:lamin tail domain-containing protein [Myxococcota bacterium]